MTSDHKKAAQQKRVFAGDVAQVVRHARKVARWAKLKHATVTVGNVRRAVDAANILLASSAARYVSSVYGAAMRQVAKEGLLEADGYERTERHVFRIAGRKCTRGGNLVVRWRAA